MKQARAEVSADQDGPSAQVSNESAGPPRANEGLGQLVTPKKHNPSTPAKASLSGSPPPSIRAELDLVSPVPRDLKDSPPRQRRCTSRPVIRLHTQPQSNPTAQSVQQPVGWPDEVEPLACSPRSRSTTTTAVADLVQEGKESDRTSISRAELMARMQGLVNGRAEAETERAEFSIDDVYELSRLGVNETEGESIDPGLQSREALADSRLARRSTRLLLLHQTHHRQLDQSARHSRSRAHALLYSLDLILPGVDRLQQCESAFGARR